jgi:hypothetical protein
MEYVRLKEEKKDIEKKITMLKESLTETSQKIEWDSSGKKILDFGKVEIEISQEKNPSRKVNEEFIKSILPDTLIKNCYKMVFDKSSFDNIQKKNSELLPEEVYEMCFENFYVDKIKYKVKL